MKWIPYGPEALLFEVKNQDVSPPQLCADLEAHPPHGFREATPGYESVLVEFQSGTHLEQKAAELTQRWNQLRSLPAIEGRVIDIPVRYNGEDLPEVARHAGLSVNETIHLHSQATYRVALLGFAPGFPYLQGLDKRLHKPRRAQPRPHIPVGSVAIGGSHTGIYSIPSPGGWNLIGQTDVRLFDPANEKAPFLLRAGDRVRFVPIEP